LAGVTCEYSILDAAESLERLDDSFWQKIARPGQNGIDIVGSPLFRPSAKPDAKTIAEVLFRIRRFYGWIVLDLGRQSRDASLLCERVDELLLVTTTAISSLYAAKRFCASISQTAINRERMRIVVNELNKDQKISREDWTSAFGNPVCGVLPPDGAELHKAALERRPPQESSSFRREMTKVARSVASLPEPRAKRAAPPLFSWKSQLQTGRA
jgi:Flp pilus assembly CpaE family ATPase